MTIITAEQLDHIDKVAQSSGVFLGFLGGFVKAVTSSHGIFDALGKMVVGSIVAWLSAPFAQAHFPDELSPMVIFLFGYGGTELVTFLQEIFKNVIGAKLEALLNKITGADLRDSLPAKGIHGTSMDAPSAVTGTANVPAVIGNGAGNVPAVVSNGTANAPTKPDFVVKNTGTGNMGIVNTGTVNIGTVNTVTDDKTGTKYPVDAMGFPRKEKNNGHVE